MPRSSGRGNGGGGGGGGRYGKGPWRDISYFEKKEELEEMKAAAAAEVAGCGDGGSKVPEEVKAEKAGDGATGQVRARSILQDPWLYYGFPWLSEESRVDKIQKMRREPLEYGVEPPIWWIADALLDFPFATKLTRLEIEAGAGGRDWETFKKDMRAKLGFESPVRSILLCGANRSSKSQYAAKRGMMMACRPMDENAHNDQRECVLGMHSMIKRSQMDQQGLFIQHMPADWREWKEGMGNRRDYSWITKRYFHKGWYTLPNGRRLDFAAYSQNVRDVLEGKIVKFANLDERFPLDWLETLEIRAAQVNGYIVATFTPVDGWTGGYGAFCDDMDIVRWSKAYLLPNDGGVACPWMALGLSKEEYDEWRRCEMLKETPKLPTCRPQQCTRWLAGQDGVYGEEPKDRTFGKVPRVARSKDGKRAIVWFHPLDNPWGNPRIVVETAMSQGTERVKRTIYGIAQKGWGKQFTAFDFEKHTIADAEIPKVGRNFMIIDPASCRVGGEGRNFFMGWGRVAAGVVYFYREWPGRYWIPGIGVPDEWSVGSGRDFKGRGNDGDKGGAQRSWGFGLTRYKFEAARLEEWADWRAWSEEVGAGPDEVPDMHSGKVQAWSPKRGTLEPIVDRLIDRRSANMGHPGEVVPVTLCDELRSVGMPCTPAGSISVDDGVKRVQALLESGRLKIAKSCHNMIFSMSNWTYVEGQQGACKDPVDVIMMFCASEYATQTPPAKEQVADFRGDPDAVKARPTEDVERTRRLGLAGRIDDRIGGRVRWSSGGGQRW